jgi:hypothetical protein
MGNSTDVPATDIPSTSAGPRGKTRADYVVAWMICPNETGLNFSQVFGLCAPELRYASGGVSPVIIRSNELINLVVNNPLFHLLHPLNKVRVVPPALGFFIQPCHLSLLPRLCNAKSLFFLLALTASSSNHLLSSDPSQGVGPPKKSDEAPINSSASGHQAFTY